MNFQSQVNLQPAPAVAGDFASANPRASVLAGPGALISGSAGVTVGRFAWADANGVVSNGGTGVPTGFVHREQQALIVNFLGASTNLIPQGQMITLHQAGDFWAKNDGASAATVGQKVYANNATGQITTGATGSPPVGASVTATLALNSFTGAISPNTFTASIAGTTMTVSALVGAQAVVYVGQTLTGTNVGAGTTVLAQLTGTSGGIGTYQVSESQTVASTTVTGSGGGMTLSAVTTGSCQVGQTITTGASAGTTIVAQLTGTNGSTGTYAVSASQTVASTSIVTSGGYLNVTAVASGALAANDVISGGTITTGTSIVAQLSGTPGGVGTYLTTTSAASSSGSVSVASGVETKWIVASAGAAGEVIKISSYPLG